MVKTLRLTLAMMLVICAVEAKAQDPKVLEVEPPVVLHARKVLPYEVTSGTIISLVLESPNELLPVALVSSNVFDFYGNVAIPKGSKLLGNYNGKVNDRHQVFWTGLQTPTSAGTLRLDPPLAATMPDGSAGLINFTPGALAAAITNEPFLMPH